MPIREVKLSPQKLEYLRASRGWTLDDLVKATEVEFRTPGPVNKVESLGPLDKRTLMEALAGEPKNIKTAWIIARAFGFQDLIPLLDEKELTAVGSPNTWDGAAAFFSQVGDWEVSEVVVPLITIANGLQYEVCRMRHRFRPNRLARGKCFDLSRTATHIHNRLRTALERHVEVCERFIGDTHIARNETVCPDKTGHYWWVIDEWIPGRTLAAMLNDNPPAVLDVPHVLRTIANTLESLHAMKIYLRELSPQHVQICGGDRQVVLTDFELAKLSDGSPTVSPAEKWPPDEYRAPEVGGPNSIDATADLYSWGRILVHAATGALPTRGKEADALARVKLPPAVHKIALACVALPRSDRPKSMTEVLHAIRNWK